MQNLDYFDIITTVPSQPGWEAIYGVGPRKDGQFITKPIAGWALVNINATPPDTLNTVVVGLVVAEAKSHVLDFADQPGPGRFVGYNYPGAGINWAGEIKQISGTALKEQKATTDKGYGKIVSLMPTLPGWEAIYETNRRIKTVKALPLIAWATVEFGAAKNTIVVALVPGDIQKVNLEFADQVGRFLGYNYPGSGIDWIARVRHLDRQNQTE